MGEGEMSVAVCDRDAVLRAAGGGVLDPSGRPLLYGKAEGGLRNGPFIAWGDAAAAERLGR